MKTLIHILLGTLLFAGSCSDEMPVCTPAVHGPRHVTFTFSCDALPGTRAVADESRVEDINLYLFPANDAPARHVYAASQRTVALELPDGRYTLYAVANLGTDTGPLPEAEVRALRSAWNPDGSDSGTLPMSAMRTFTVRGTTQIAIELVRAVAKVDFSYTVAADFSRSLSVRSVRLCNVRASRRSSARAASPQTGSAPRRKPSRRTTTAIPPFTTFRRTCRARTSRFRDRSRRTRPMPRNMPLIS